MHISNSGSFRVHLKPCFFAEEAFRKTRQQFLQLWKLSGTPDSSFCNSKRFRESPTPTHKLNPYALSTCYHCSYPSIHPKQHYKSVLICPNLRYLRSHFPPKNKMPFATPITKTHPLHLRLNNKLWWM